MSKELLQKVIDWYDKDSSVGMLSNLIDDIKEELAKPDMSQKTKLRAFAQEVMDSWPDDLHGEDLQDVAVRNGLLRPEIRYSDCSVEGVSSCLCAEYYSQDEFKAGVECFRKTDILKGIK